MHASVDLGPFAGFDRGDCDRSRGYAPGILKRFIAIFFDSRFSLWHRWRFPFCLPSVEGRKGRWKFFNFIRHLSFLYFLLFLFFLVWERLLFKIVKIIYESTSTFFRYLLTKLRIIIAPKSIIRVNELWSRINEVT